MKTSCAVLMSDLAKEFSVNNHQVTVITPTSNFNEKSSLRNYDNYQLYRFRSFKIVDVSFTKRALNELFLPITFLFSHYFSQIKREKFDYIIWYSPSIFLSPIIWLIKRKSKAKTYLILRDIFPEWTLDLGLMNKGIIYKFFKFIASFQYKIADVIGIQSESNFEIIKNKVSSKKVEVLNNWNSDSEMLDIEDSIINLKTFRNKKIIVYIGNMGIAQDMNFIIDLIEEFKSNNQELVFLFIGRGNEVKNLKHKAQIKNLENLKFFDEIPHKNAMNLLRKCSVGLISLDPRHKSHNIPGKFISYLQSGLPVIARINPKSDLENIITKNNVGIVYSDYNIDEFGEMINEMISNETELNTKSLNARKLFKNKFETKSAYKQLISHVNN
tara:strand:+ start:6156 stop:7310 length:1155 start_codon:yes stop_codon:yes gene_type:complete